MRYVLVEISFPSGEGYRACLKEGKLCPESQPAPQGEAQYYVREGKFFELPEGVIPLDYWTHNENGESGMAFLVPESSLGNGVT